MSCCSPKNVIASKRTRAFAAHGERLPIGREYQSVATLRLRSGVSLRVFIEREGGIVRAPEGIETPPPGNSSERPWSKHREPDIRIVEVGGSSLLTSTVLNHGMAVLKRLIDPYTVRRTRAASCLGQSLSGRPGSRRS